MINHQYSRKDFGVKHWTHYRWADVHAAIRGKIHKTMWTNVNVASRQLIRAQIYLEAKP